MRSPCCRLTLVIEVGEEAWVREKALEEFCRVSKERLTKIMRPKIASNYRHIHSRSPDPNANTTEAPHPPEDPVVHSARGEQPFHVCVEFWVHSEGFLQGKGMLKCF